MPCALYVAEITLYEPKMGARGLGHDSTVVWCGRPQVQAFTLLMGCFTKQKTLAHKHPLFFIAEISWKREIQNSKFRNEVILELSFQLPEVRGKTLVKITKFYIIGFECITKERYIRMIKALYFISSL